MADQAKLRDVMDGLRKLVGQIHGFIDFKHGPNIDVEGKSPEAPYGFICVFENETALHRYTDDPRHRALGAQLVVLCEGAHRIKVYDLKVPCDAKK